MVNKWTITDGTFTMTFQFNPYTMSSPYAPKDLSVDTASMLVVKRPGPANEWTFTGNVYNDEEYNKLVDWHEKDMILELTDHLQRTWQIVSVDLNMTDRRNTARNSERYDYTWKVLNMGRVEESS
jgi:hypothetical protein